MPIRLRIRITGEGSTKASEAIDALLDVREVPCRIVRVAMRTEKQHTPMELDFIRKPRSSDKQAREVEQAVD